MDIHVQVYCIDFVVWQEAAYVGLHKPRMGVPDISLVIVDINECRTGSHNCDVNEKCANCLRFTFLGS